MRDYAELITRLKQSDDNCNAECCECSGECLSSGCNIFSDAADAIEELLAAVPKWISVEERLPEQYKPVHVSYVGYNTNSLLSDMVAYRDGDGDWCWWDGEFPSGELCKVKITHRMPLPAPPKEVQDD